LQIAQLAIKVRRRSLRSFMDGRGDSLLLILCRADQQERTEYEKRQSYRDDQTDHIGPN
jgi:hypothetical protein